MSFSLHQQAINAPTYHIECSVDQKFSTESLKRQIFGAMNQLEGWCSKQKASILTDLILLTRPKTIVEIGVFGGKSLIPMAFALKHNQDGGKIYGIDPWQADCSIVGMETVNKDYWSKVDHDAILQGLLNKIDLFRLQGQIDLIKDTSASAAPIYNIDVLHIDGNHSEEISYSDVCKWVPMVKKGGIIVFDDINWSTTSKAVEWLDQNCTKWVDIKGDNIWGIWIKP